MAMIADILLVAGALGAGLYCLVLSKRLTKFTDLEKGVGGAVAVLSAQVDDLTRTLREAQSTATFSTDTLEALTIRADGVAQRLELLCAAMHDIPEAQAPAPAVQAPEPEPATQLAPEQTIVETEPELSAAPEPAVTPEPEVALEPEIAPEPERAAEPEPEPEPVFSASPRGALPPEEPSAEQPAVEQPAAEAAVFSTRRAQIQEVA